MTPIFSAHGRIAINCVKKWAPQFRQDIDSTRRRDMSTDPFLLQVSAEHDVPEYAVASKYVES